MRLRYAGSCRVCGADLPARTEAVYERTTKTVRCVTHTDSLVDARLEGVSDIGGPGASARQAFDRRRRLREERIRDEHPRLARLMLALQDDPPSTKAWMTGAVGEETLGRRLNELASDRVRLLHDRQVPGSKANIDHLAVTPSGVYVIDAKRFKGRPQLRVEGGVLRPRVEKLMIDTRDRTNLVHGVHQQIEIVRNAVGDDELPVTGVLCFIDADFPLIGGAFAIGGVEVLWPRRLFKKLASEGPLDHVAIDRTHHDLAAVLPVR